MREKNHHPISLILLILSLLIGLTSAPTLAQEQETPPYIAITGSAVSSPPMIDLYAYGLDAQGNPLDLAQQTLSVQHNGVPVGQAQVTGSHSSGTFTLFLIDIPPGVAEQLPDIEEAIKQYASAPNMAEGVDAVTVYKVGETAADQILAPDTFHNSVRNLFATPLTPETGATALVDSLGGLLEQIDSLKTSPDMAPAIVVMTDGTDVVSSRFDENAIGAQAAALGIPIHTIWLTNENLSPASQQFGQEYLAQVAADSRGLTAQLQNDADVAAIWSRIASFREQSVVSYPVNELVGGDYDVALSLDGSLVTRAETTVSVSGNLPMVAFNLPPESRALSLPDLEKPVKLRFATTLSWLDGEERSLAAAQLLVNNAVYDIAVEEIAQFEVELNNLNFGDNSFQIAALDTQGLRVTSPTIFLTVSEGSESIPPELEASGGGWGLIGRGLLFLLAVAGLGVAVFLAWRQGWLSGLATAVPRGPSRPRPPVTIEDAPNYEESYQPTQVLARLEVLEATTDTPAEFALGKTLMKIGRSPAQSDIAFEEDITVSRLHGSLHLEGRHYRIFDERSSSGIWVNDQKVPEYGIQLMDGDEIHLGAVHLRYRQP